MNQAETSGESVSFLQNPSNFSFFLSASTALTLRGTCLYYLQPVENYPTSLKKFMNLNLKSTGRKCSAVYVLKPSKHTTATKEGSGEKEPRITSDSETQEIIFTMMNIGVHIYFSCSLFNFFLIKTQK